MIDQASGHSRRSRHKHRSNGDVLHVQGPIKQHAIGAMMSPVRGSDAFDAHTPTDEALVVEALADPAAFDQLYQRYHGDIHRFVLSRVADLHQAEDITSQVFLQALRGLPTHGSGTFRGWLFRIARNAIVDSYRRQPPEAPSDALAVHAALEPGPLALIEVSEAREELWRIINRLAGTQQAIIRLRLDGYTGQEIADELGMSLSAIKSAQFRAFEKIRGLMTGSPGRSIGPRDQSGNRSR
jgi:RNA polymerase sigma-70 factor (ECF subfamily)